MSKKRQQRNGVALVKADAPENAMQELGATGLAESSGRIYEEWLRQLMGTQFFRAMREMADNDPIVGAMLFAIEMLMRGVTWDVNPYSSDAADVERRDFVDANLKGMSHTMADFISEWMACPVYGFAPFEIVFKRGDDGKIMVRKLAIRHPDTLDHWEFDESGGVKAMAQQSMYTQKGPVTIPIEKLLLFRVGMRKGNPEGRSLLRNSYIPYRRKKRIEEIEAVGIERDLAGLPTIYTPASWHSATATSGDKALLEEAKKIGRNIRNDEQACLVLPMIKDAEGNQLLKVELLTTGGRRNFDTGAVVQRYDQRIAMTILADVILIGHEAVGSFALSSSKTNLFSAGLGALLDDIAAVLNRHLVPRLFALNGMDPANPPEIVHGDIESTDLTELGDYVQKIAAAGFPLGSDAELENELRARAGFPPKPVEEMPVAEEVPNEPALPDESLTGDLPVAA